MRNETTIINKKAKQIKKLLSFLGCYTYTDEGIDVWLAEWKSAKKDMIEDIAEKSEFYNGDCKIVFPSQYPRDINPKQIKLFADWLSSLQYQIEPAKINGYTYSGLHGARDTFYALCSNVYDYIRNENIPSEDKIISEEQYQELLNIDNKLSEVWDEFRCSDQYVWIYGNYYTKESATEYGIEEARRLAEMLYNYLTIFSNQYLSSKAIQILGEYFPSLEFAEGQKFSKAVMTICRTYGIKKVANFEREFAKFADAVNPLMVTKWTVISWDPIDYLTAAFGDRWGSCIDIDKRNVRRSCTELSHSSVTDYVDSDGSYHFSGSSASTTLAYMFDRSTFVYYTVDKRYEGDAYELENKVTRCFFSISNDYSTLLQSRMYPQYIDDMAGEEDYRVPREIVQKIVADTTGVPNLWTVKKGTSACQDVACVEFIHADFYDNRNRKCNVSYLSNKEKQPIYIGSTPLCPNCGCEHEIHYSLNCDDCLR